ncbi:hypothetical protein QJS10_CPA05g00444 [Acorus calamus]|uniref:Uncharacterized protein n=1 Tax=Acorus calamus TaxID=4465 RepID=A0AAV9EVM7_ACOCL|nr:hypothetical protein QJS10_CPA05g00444 [Acorus calamus]
MEISLSGNAIKALHRSVTCLARVGSEIVLQASFLRSKFPSNFVVRPRDFNRLLANFQSSLQEITIIATESTPLSSDVGGSIGGKAVELRSYIDPTKDNSDTSLHTQLWIDPSEEFLQYRHSGNPVDAFISFCEACEAEVQLFFEKAGEPILMALKFGFDDNSSSDFDATLVLATMLTSQLCEGGMPGQPSAAPGSCDQNNLGRDPQSQHAGGGATTPNTVHNSEHTKIWSELSGSAAKSSASAEVRQAQVGGNPNSNIQNGMERFHVMDNSTTLPEREHMAKTKRESSLKINSTIERDSMVMVGHSIIPVIGWVKEMGRMRRMKVKKSGFNETRLMMLPILFYSIIIHSWIANLGCDMELGDGPAVDEAPTLFVGPTHPHERLRARVDYLRPRPLTRRALSNR